MPTKSEREFSAIEFHARIRAARSRSIAFAIAWIAARVGEMLLVHRSRRALRVMRDEELDELGLTRAEVERAGWF